MGVPVRGGNGWTKITDEDVTRYQESVSPLTIWLSPPVKDDIGL